MPLFVDSVCPSVADQPVTVGVPFPKGALPDQGDVELVGPEGAAVALQAETLARWSDGSVKWLLLDFVTPRLGPGGAGWALRVRPGGDRDAGAGGRLRVSQGPSSVVIETGTATFHVDRDCLRPLARAARGGQEVLAPSGARVVLADGKGRKGAGRVEELAVEAAGPVRATVRLAGTFKGCVGARFLARLCFFTGTGLIRLRLTVHNPNRARHRGGLWDLGDPGSLLVRDLSLELPLAGAAPSRVRWTAELGQPARSGEGPLEVYQDSSGGDNWRSRNHVNREGRVPCSFRGYRVRAPGCEAAGDRASPVVAVEGAGGCVGAAVPEFWQQFPKALEVQGSTLRVRLFPRQFGDLFELQGGEQKTHTVWLHFGTDGESALAALEWVHQPAHVRASPDWYATSGAVPHLAPAGGGPADSFELLVGEAVQGAKSLFAGREVIDEYGWRNFGEVYADHEGEHYRGPAPVVSHYNNQYDIVLGTSLQYLRTGDARWLGLMAPLARHVLDIDLYHTTRDRASYNGGLFWMTDHYLDAATCTHRTYSRHNKPAGRDYGGGPSSNHLFSTGLLHYFYLTGDPLARDAVVGLADWVVHMDDGRRNVLGVVDPGPTGLASMTRDLGYHGPGRGGGNSVNALLDGWLLTGRTGYLGKAEELIRRCVHPSDDVEGLNLLDAEKRWSYTMFLSALARYLAVKAEAGEPDFLYAYARSALLRYARWMLEHETPYLDHPERLEYPTEAWAGQELRKANVLRLAAEHTGESLRGRLLRRGEELADRAWEDLCRFETRTSARALALVMTEGPRDDFFRRRPAGRMPEPAGSPDFGRPEGFVPQKYRVLARLRSARGLAGAFVRLADVRRWWRLWSRGSV